MARRPRKGPPPGLASELELVGSVKDFHRIDSDAQSRRISASRGFPDTPDAIETHRSSGLRVKRHDAVCRASVLAATSVYSHANMLAGHLGVRFRYSAKSAHQVTHCLLKEACPVRVPVVEKHPSTVNAARQ